LGCDDGVEKIGAKWERRRLGNDVIIMGQSKEIR